MEEYKSVQDTENLIVIDDGRIDVPILNQFKETLGVFRFNPTDINIVNRYNESVDKFGEILKPLENYDISADGEGEGDGVAALNYAEEKIIEVMDYVFDCDSKSSFFQKTHAFAVNGGRFYCETIFEAVGNFIGKKFETETKKMNARIKKYTHGYKTGKHAKGWQ